MNYSQLSILSVFSFFSLIAMESPLGILLDDTRESREATMLAQYETPERAHELLEASNMLLGQHLKFSQNYLRAAALAPLLQQPASTRIPELSEWRKMVIPHWKQLTHMGPIGSVIQQLFDEELEKEDNSTHINSMAARIALTNQLQMYNEDYYTCRQHLQKLFGPTLQKIAFKKLMTIKEIKKALAAQHELDVDRKLFFVCDYIEFLTQHLDSQIQFLSCLPSIYTILQTPIAERICLPTLENMKRYQKQQQGIVLNYCTSCLKPLSEKTLTIARNQLKEVIAQNKQIKACDEKHLNMLKNVQEAEEKERTELFAQLNLHRALLTNHFCQRYSSYLKDIAATNNSTLASLNKAAQKNKSTPNSKPQNPPLPICSLKVISHSPIEIQNLKSQYKHHIQFRLKESLQEADTNRVASVLYFFSKGDAINDGLFVTNGFVFKSAEELRHVEQASSSTLAKEVLCYTHANGNYYFVNLNLYQNSRDAVAHKVDYVAALTLAQQQPPRAKIEPQVGNGANNKK